MGLENRNDPKPGGMPPERPNPMPNPGAPANRPPMPGPGKDATRPPANDPFGRAKPAAPTPAPASGGASHEGDEDESGTPSP